MTESSSTVLIVGAGGSHGATGNRVARLLRSDAVVGELSEPKADPLDPHELADDRGSAAV
jgi:hypothetical protein